MPKDYTRIEPRNEWGTLFKEVREELDAAEQALHRGDLATAYERSQKVGSAAGRLYALTSQLRNRSSLEPANQRLSPPLEATTLNPVVKGSMAR